EPYSYWHQICILVNMAIIFGLLFLLIRFWKTVRSKMTTPWQVFSWMVAGIILMLILLTGYLSITQSPYRHTLKESHFWTFIGDGRYYTFAFVLIPVILSRVIFRRNPDQGIITKTAQYLFVSLLCFSIIHTTSFLIKRWDVEKVTEHATFPL